jgi:hypothetical protein
MARFISKISNLPESAGVADLSGCGVNNENVQSLVDALNLKPSITILILDYNGISDNGLIELAKLKYIQVLDLRRNPICGGISALASNEVFEFIGLCNTSVGDEALAPLNNIKRKNKLILGLSECGPAKVASKNPNITFNF